jgi:adenosylcobinamide-phosphate synthase
MSFSALLAALLLEYFRPFPGRFRRYSWFVGYANFLEHVFNAGEHRQGVLAWLLGAVPLSLLVAGAGYALGTLNPLLAWAWSIGVLYLAMGFKEFSLRGGNIAALLRREEVDQARHELGLWTGRDSVSLSSGAELARLAIEETLSCAYLQLFGSMVWFVLLGPGGVVLYRLAQILGHKWSAPEGPEFGEFGVFAARVRYWMEWLPVRLTAISLAVMGDFEDAMYCWRSQSGQWLDPELGIVLASGAGALGVRLGSPLAGQEGGTRPELGVGDEADADYLDSALSLVWRVLVMWLVVLLLLTLARWSGA